MSLTNSSAPLRSAILNNTNDVEMTNVETSTIGVVQVTNKVQTELALECRKRPYLDGRYFEPDLNISTVNGIITGICQLCKAKSIHRPIRGSFQTPSNYTTHIQKVHADSLEAYKEHVVRKRQKKNDEAEKMMRTYCNFSQAKFEENVISYILESMAPFNTVECSSFRKIFDDMKIKKGGKKLAHISARTVGRRIITTFKKNMQSIRTMIGSVEYVCTTADIWTSRSRRFIGMTVHWIDKNTFDRKSYAIACRRFSGTHSFDRVARIIDEVHHSFKIDKQKVVATVTDNGSNFVKAFLVCGINFNDFFSKDDEDNNESEEREADLNSSSDSEGNPSSQEVSESEEECYSEQNESAEKESLSTVMEEELQNILPAHIRCASHTLNLVATTDAMVCVKSTKSLESSYNKMIDRCTSLWQLLSAPKKAENAKSILGKSLKRPVATRWNSLYDSLIQIFGLKEKILKNVQALEMTKPLEEADFRFIEEYCRCHQPIAQAIDVLQGDQVASYGYLLPTLIMTRKKLMACRDLKFHYCQKLVLGLIGAIEKRFKNIFDVVEEGRTAAVAAASHPMFKLRWLSALSKSAQDNVMEAIQDAIKCFSDTPVDQPQELQAGTIDNFFDFGDRPLTTALNSVAPSTSTSPSSFAPNTYIASSSSARPLGSIVPEVNFIKFTAETRTDFQILNFYPIVREIFLKTNTILPSSAPVERLFSYATMYDLPKYNKLSDKKFELRVIMKCNASVAKKKN